MYYRYVLRILSTFGFLAICNQVDAYPKIWPSIYLVSLNKPGYHFDVWFILGALFIVHLSIQICSRFFKRNRIMMFLEAVAYFTWHLMSSVHLCTLHHSIHNASHPFFLIFPLMLRLTFSRICLDLVLITV